MLKKKKGNNTSFEISLIQTHLYNFIHIAVILNKFLYIKMSLCVNWIIPMKCNKES